jgi:hypothetical protein
MEESNMQTTVHPLGRTTYGAVAVRILGLAALASLVTAGCLHHDNMAACTPRPGESECWQSSRRDADGRVRHLIVERRTSGPRCDEVRIEQSSFDENDELIERVVEERRCGVVDHRTIDRYDLAAGELERAIWTDSDHDDQFDRYETQTVTLPKSPEDRDAPKRR